MNIFRVLSFFFLVWSFILRTISENLMQVIKCETLTRGRPGKSVSSPVPLRGTLTPVFSTVILIYISKQNKALLQSLDFTILNFILKLKFTPNHHCLSSFVMRSGMQVLKAAVWQASRPCAPQLGKDMIGHTHLAKFRQ